MPTFGVGDQALWGWAPEVTSGTFVSPTGYIGLEPGQPAPRFNPARTGNDIAGGSPNVTGSVTDRKGSGTWQVNLKLYPSLNLDFLAACGLTGSGLVAPSSLSLQVNAGGKSLKYAGCRANRIVLSGSMDQDFMAQVSGFFTTRPVPASLLSTPTWTITDPYIWTDLGQLTLLSGATTASDLESFSLTVDMVHAMGYGNSGVPLANIVKHSRFNIAGQIAAYMNDTNYVELADMFANGGVAGALSVPFVSGGNSVTIAVPNAKYTTGDVTLPAQGLDLMTLQLQSFSPSLTNQMSFTVV